ncbi:MAG: hypothetical protein IPM71_03695 [Bacteroidota bacterium]|nr:MAG: hypothetical protein IPM71_03695 [Bacteroidota bacterium]
MFKKINKKKLYILAGGIIVGMAAGYAYWHFIGCTSGTCPLTSNWHTSTLMGGIFGYLISDSIKVKNTDTEKNISTENVPEQSQG